FGAGGKVTTDFSGGLEEVSAIALQADGRIVAAGRRTGPTDVEGLAADFALARYNANGSLDSTFGANGRVITDFGASDMARGVAGQPDGKIVAAGTNAGSLALARYSADGLLGAGFGAKDAGDVVAASLGAAAVDVQPVGCIE